MLVLLSQLHTVLLFVSAPKNLSNQAAAQDNRDGDQTCENNTPAVNKPEFLGDTYNIQNDR